MHYLVLSDSHRHSDRILRILDRQISRPAAVFFLGDGVSDLPPSFDNTAIYTVRGNCDGFLSPGDNSPWETLVTVEGLRILLVHGHLFQVKYGIGAAAAHAAELGADLLLFGHTHEPYLETVPSGADVGGVLLSKPLTLFNPGAVADGSFGVLTIRNGVPLCSHGNSF